MRTWWRTNREEQRTSLLFTYALGKAQRVIAELAAAGLEGPIYCHGAVEAMNEIYRTSGVMLPATRRVGEGERGIFAGALVLGPPSAQRTPWVRRFGDYSSAFVSGWMRRIFPRRSLALEADF